MDADYYPAPIPSRQALLDWARHLQQGLERDVLTAEQAVSTLADVRRASRDFGALADALLLAARDQGASLPELATAWSTSGRRELVHGPDSRLKTLADRVGTADDVLATFMRTDQRKSQSTPDPGQAPRNA